MIALRMQKIYTGERETATKMVVPMWVGDGNGNGDGDGDGKS